MSAATLFRERGYSGTGFRDVIEHSGAPRGSIYHHFPGGKAELAAEVARFAGDVIAARMERAMADGDPVAALRIYVDGWRRALESTDYRAGCPIVAIAIEHHDDPAPLDAAAAAFARWEEMFAGSLRASGIGRARAARLATATIAGIEGAVVLCRARRETQPLEDVARELEQAITAAS